MSPSLLHDTQAWLLMSQIAHSMQGGHQTYWIEVELLPDGLVGEELIANADGEAKHSHATIQDLSWSPQENLQHDHICNRVDV